ncbi:acyl carrier protein [Streptomyces sp. NPDC002795]|uniref:acyl carrier protein n=1 Tax=Streptomyces sp. NPDC002795 TaxID=3364665 RepID=UPI0036916F39
MTVDQAVLDWFSINPSDMTQPPEPEEQFIPDLPPAPVAAIRGAAPVEQERLLEDLVCQEIGRVLQCPAEAVDRHQTMTDLGVGSMIGLELQRHIAAALKVEVELTFILRAADTGTLARHLLGLLTPSKAGTDQRDIADPAAK